MPPRSLSHRWLRTLGYGSALLGLGLYSWFALEVYLSRKDPEGFRGWNGASSWIVGPPASALGRAAEEHMREGLRQLNDATLPPTTRIRAYHRELRAAEELLVRTVRSQPASPHALTQLAAVRWELDPPTTPEAQQSFLDLIALASEMAPTVPAVQRRLGELLFKMGRQEEGLEYLALTLELDPRSGLEIVEFLRQNLLTAEEIQAALPAEPWLLVALERPFSEDGQEARFLAIVERLFADEPLDLPTRILWSYSDTCLRQGDPSRILRTLDALGSRTEPEFEAERLRQRSRAHLALGARERAMQDAVLARGSWPSSSLTEHLGDTALAVGDAELALRSFRDALGLLARGQGSPELRARIYRKIGQAEEKVRNPARAYDAYKLALSLDADEPHARRRIAEMEEATGRKP